VMMSTREERGGQGSTGRAEGGRRGSDHPPADEGGGGLGTPAPHHHLVFFNPFLLRAG